MDKSPIVFVVDDDGEVLLSLRRLIESVGLKVETFCTTDEFLQFYDHSRPGCLVLDVRLPGASGLDLLEQLPGREITLPVIVLTAYGDVPTAVRALKNGAVDFIEKPFIAQVLLDSIQNHIEHDRHQRSEQADRLELSRRLGRLTPREREVMELVVIGRANKQVAAELGCSCKTVEVHRSRVMEKMGAGSIAELVRMSLLNHCKASCKPDINRETPIDS